jgi:hypothetical protein
VYFGVFCDNIIFMLIQQLVSILIVVVLIIAAISVKFLRKTIGLLLVILGSIACLSIIGVVVGVPMIIVGGIFLFI